jgi:aminoglycoside phosphotransferase family enzyme
MMEEKKDKLSDALNLNPMTIQESVQGIISKAHDDSAKNDFELARGNIHEIIQNSAHAIEKLSQIADSSQHPRAFEVLAKLMETALQANKDLLDLQKQIREIEASDTPINERAQSVTNNLFVGSTAELQKVIDNMKKSNE